MTATGPEGDLADTVLVDAVRREVGPVVAGLHRLTGDFDVAEEAVQDALVGVGPVSGLLRRSGLLDPGRRDRRGEPATGRLAP